MYLPNKYTKWYYNIINRAQSRVLPEEVYTEKHHVIPRSLGGSDDSGNIAVLTAREHWICHLLLTKMTTGNDRYKMAYALNMMTHVQRIGEGRYLPPSKLYEYSKEIHREAITRCWTPEKRKEHAKKISKITRGRKHLPETIEKMKNKKWTKRAEESRLKNCLKSAKKYEGSQWMYHPETNEVKKLLKGESLPEGWALGRPFNWDRYQRRNGDYFNDVFDLFDQGLNRRQIALELDITWDRVNFMINNRNTIEEKFKEQ